VDKIRAATLAGTAIMARDRSIQFNYLIEKHFIGHGKGQHQGTVTGITVSWSPLAKSR
jgi:hypothetical protein